MFRVFRSAQRRIPTISGRAIGLRTELHAAAAASATRQAVSSVPRLNPVRHIRIDPIYGTLTTTTANQSAPPPTPIRYRYLSFYRYVTTPRHRLPQLQHLLQTELRRLGVLGRIYIGAEGVNAQVMVPLKQYNAFVNGFLNGQLRREWGWSDVYLNLGQIIRTTPPGPKASTNKQFFDGVIQPTRFAPANLSIMTRPVLDRSAPASIEQEAVSTLRALSGATAKYKRPPMQLDDNTIRTTHIVTVDADEPDNEFDVPKPESIKPAPAATTDSSSAAAATATAARAALGLDDDYSDASDASGPADDVAPFRDLSVLIRHQIVADALPTTASDAPLDVHKNSGTKLAASEWHERLSTPPPPGASAGVRRRLILDTRNLYETEIGRFRNATHLPIDAYRQLWSALDSLIESSAKESATAAAAGGDTIHSGRIDPKSTEVFLYCTGGIRW